MLLINLYSLPDLFYVTEDEGGEQCGKQYFNCLDKMLRVNRGRYLGYGFPCMFLLWSFLVF